MITTENPFTTVRPTDQGKWPEIDLPYYGQVSLGNATQFRMMLNRLTDGKIHISIEGRGAYAFDAWVHVSYAMEKLGLFEADAANVADLLNHLIPAPLDIVQGRYEPDLCASGEAA